MERIDVYPTHEHEGYKLRPGQALSLRRDPGAGGSELFRLFARMPTYLHAGPVSEKGGAPADGRDPFRGCFGRTRTFWGDSASAMSSPWSCSTSTTKTSSTGFAWTAPVRVRSRASPRSSLRSDHDPVDPYAKAIGGRDVWGEQPDWDDIYPHRARIVHDDFDWDSDRPLEIPTEDLVIYEMHVRGFTRHPSSGVKHPGTFAGIREKIPYLKELGVNCIELMPIYEFDEFENSRPRRDTGELLMNYWGYSTVGFFAPKAGFAASGRMRDATHGGRRAEDPGEGASRNGIEVILDVVFNHTAEGNEEGMPISFRGIDNSTYYMLTPEGYYFNFSGTGNTLNCNNPIVRTMVLECLRYWAAEYHIDGFRFDLAAILGRDPWGAPLANPPLLETLAFDPILAKCKLDRRSLGRRRTVPGGFVPGLWPMGGMEREVPRHASLLPQGRPGTGRKLGSSAARLPRPVCAGRAESYGVDQLHHLPRRLHAFGPRLLQRKAQRGQRRGQSRRRRRQQQLELRLGRLRQTIPRSRRCGSADEKCSRDAHGEPRASP